jgi:hypothetical protein
MDEPAPLLRLTVPGPAPDARRVPPGGYYQPDRLAGEFPPDPAEREDESSPEVRGVSRRLVVAFAAIVSIGLLNFLVLRRFDADLHPLVLLGSFAIILTASVFSLLDRSDGRAHEAADTAADGCAIGACPGPRPVGELSRRARAGSVPRLTGGRSTP